MIGRKNAIGVEISDERWAVSHLEGGMLARGPVANFTIEGDPGERAEKLKAYMTEMRLGSPMIALAFPEKESLFKVLSLPSTGTKTISKMLGFELERHLPSDIDAWRWSFAPLKAEGNSTAIMFSALKATSIEAVLSVLKAHDISPALMTSGQAALAEAQARSGFLPAQGLSAAVCVGPNGFILQLFRAGALEYSSKATIEVAEQAFSLALSYAKESPSSLLVIDEGIAPDRLDRFLGGASPFCGQARVFGPIPALSRAFGAALMALDRDASAASFNEQDTNLSTRKKSLAAAAIGVLAVVLAGGAVAVNDVLALKKVERQIAALGEERIRAEALLKEVEAKTRDMDALDEIKNESSPGFLATLARLTELTPEDTYLTGLEYGRETIIVDGVSQKASGLFMNLSRSGMAGEINYDGPVLRGQDGKERFRIKFRNAGGHGDEDTRFGS